MVGNHVVLIVDGQLGFPKWEAALVLFPITTSFHSISSLLWIWALLAWKTAFGNLNLWYWIPFISWLNSEVKVVPLPQMTSYKWLYCIWPLCLHPRDHIPHWPKLLAWAIQLLEYQMVVRVLTGVIISAVTAMSKNSSLKNRFSTSAKDWEHTKIKPKSDNLFFCILNCDAGPQTQASGNKVEQKPKYARKRSKQWHSLLWQQQCSSCYLLMLGIIFYIG